jgi:glycosyltransferase involved in cell wall biosynthesis
MRQSILITTDWFSPGYKAGGIIRTCYNLVRLLEDHYSIYILTTDRDLGDQKPYENIVADQWTKFSNSIQIYYASPQALNWRNIRQQIKSVNAESIYINSMFSKHFTVWPLLMKKMGVIKSNIIVSPNGMLKVKALNIKPLKKKPFLLMLKLMGASKFISFHASDIEEKKRITTIFGQNAVIWQIFNPPPPTDDHLNYISKKAGIIKMAFIGRIHPIKNLHFLINCLQTLSQIVELTIIGPIEDKQYYNECNELIKRLPKSIKVSFTGEVTNEKIADYLQENHFMVLPSLGENYCYAIVESFCAGRPVIISDQTPWRNLTEKKAGWDLPLIENAFIETLKIAADMDNEEYSTWSTSAWEFAKYINNSNYKTEYIRMFDNAKMPV